MRSDLLIVGASHAGVATAAFARQSGFRGSIALLGDEPHLPYHRPPLTKTAGTCAQPQLLRPADFYPSAGIDLRLGKRVASVQPEHGCVATQDGEQIRYERLVLATGGRNRSLGVEAPHGVRNILSIRTLDDVRRLERALHGAARVCIVGSGFIALEAASLLRRSGTEVTVVCRGPRVLRRQVSTPIAMALQHLHQGQGVTFLFEREIARFVGDADVHQVVLRDGDTLFCDMVLVAVGLEPNVELWQSIEKAPAGIPVDRIGRTCLDGIYAVGDCAAVQHPWARRGRHVRIESVQAAADLARVAAESIACGRSQPLSVPTFWSDQAGTRLQVAGLADPEDESVVLAVGEGATCALRVAQGLLTAVEAVNAPRLFVAGKKLLQDGPTAFGPACSALSATAQLLKEQA